MINITNLRTIRLMEFYQVMSSVQTFLAQANLQNPKLQALITEFDTQFAALDQALKPLSKSEFTEQISELDALRDRYFMGLYSHAKVFATHPEEAQQKAAKALILVIEKYGKNIQSKPLQEETGILSNLLEDLSQSPYAEAVQTMGATAWTTAIAAANNQLISLYNQRTEQKGAIEIGRSKQARKEMQEVFKQLVQTINALIVIEGDTEYQNLVNNINTTIKQALL
ncbi:DUF6261 family protein [Riemerella columbina]|uniref:DUF6261 family protein n=1 Tax=Riemerella columbina TaxID=103810 RepID=UPI0026704685|nr:DUF6261 family protein [Riemerella columbina]WKS95800.1 DUF6261 family protein [Riemerella columbina]